MRNRGTPMKMSRRLAMARYLMRTKQTEKLKELLRPIRLGIATKQQVYGYQPTKGGAHRGHKAKA